MEGVETPAKRIKMNHCTHWQTAGLEPPRASQKVYRDECCHCFHSQDDELGVDVCLSCFQAGCLEPGRDHARGHRSLFPDHSFTLNVKRREKPRDPAEDAAQAKMDKLAVKAETDADRYEYTTEVRCHRCDAAVQTEDAPELARIVDGVMKSLSSAQQDEVQAWEQEMLPCAHVLTLQQETSRKLADSGLATCSACELGENLWLCLVCGNLACGRKQFGGGGGNGHGLEHVDSTGHTVAVKLGSITPEGTADIYCYSCDEERLDPELKTHLAHWGIVLADRVKTERSLQEMQIEQNMRWEFSMTSEDGKEMEPLFGSGFTGLANLGNSCYLASTVQCLFSLPAFQQRFLAPFVADTSAVVSDPANDLETQLRKLADGLLSGRFSKAHAPRAADEKPYQKGIAPAMFKALVGKGHAEFASMRQQDAFEFLLHLIEKLDRLKAPPAAVNAGIQNPAQSMRFQVEQRTQCRACKRVALRTTTQDNISVLVPARKVNDPPAIHGDGNEAPPQATYESVTIEELLDLFTAEEVVEYACAACGAKGEGAAKQTLFATFPDVLVLNPGRFAVENWVPVKLEIPVEIPQSGVALDKYKARGLQPGEELLPEDDGPASQGNAPALDEAAVQQLEAMGFPRNRCEKALHATGNAGADGAMEWLFAHMDDADIDEPFQAPVASSGAASGSGAADPLVVAQLESMGFPRNRCEKAALSCPGAGAEAAMEWLFAHMEDADIDEPFVPATADASDAVDVNAQKYVGDDTLPAIYKCKAMACHKGSSIHAGHYVAFVHRPVPATATASSGDGGADDSTAQEDWVLYNDEKVVRGLDWREAAKTAYVYFFERVRV